MVTGRSPSAWAEACSSAVAHWRKALTRAAAELPSLAGWAGAEATLAATR